MRKDILVAGLAIAALSPAFALAATPCERQSNNRAVGTVVGAGLGAVAGSAIAGRGSHTEGAILGGIAGAVIGNQVSRGNLDCSRAYGYYDDRGMWHATGVARSDAQGYYDREGHWVAGAPSGYYDSDGRWVSAAGDPGAAGYYDRNGYWVPAASGGYYDRDGRWVSNSAGYWRNGRWVAGPAVGHYDDNGVWISGEPAGRMDSNGVWVADAQPGYWDNGRWVRGSAYGYYDAGGRWVSTRYAVASNAPTTYAYSRGTADADLDARLDRLERRIRRDVASGRISSSDGDRALDRLNDIRHDEQRLIGRLDEVRSDLRIARDDPD